MCMRFAVGDLVLVPSLGKGIVREIRRGGRYVVDIKGRSFVLHEQQVVAPQPTTPKPVTPAPSTTQQRLARSHVPTSIDLHGMTADEAVSAVDSLMNEAILAGHDVLRVIHGRSGGRLKAAVHSLLKNMPAVTYRLDPRNPGVTIITFHD
jgi:dsDNA-specific endonuclease/ATPase MutS2